MAYTDVENMAFSKIAYCMTLDSQYRNLKDRYPDGKVPLSEVLDDETKQALYETFGLEESAYADWSIVGSWDYSETSGLSGCIIDTGDGHAAMAFRGSQSMTKIENLNDWISDAELFADPPTIQQKHIDMLLDNPEVQSLLRSYDGVTFTGHSLGGNNAEYATIAAEKKGLGDVIERCVSFDAPNHNDRFAKKYKNEIAQVSGKMTHYRWSLVGYTLPDLEGVTYINAGICYNDEIDDGLLTSHDMKYVLTDRNGNIIENPIGGYYDWQSFTDWAQDNSVKGTIVFFLSSAVFMTIAAFSEAFGVVGSIPGWINDKIKGFIDYFWDLKPRREKTPAELAAAEAAENVYFKVDPQHLLRLRGANSQLPHKLRVALGIVNEAQRSPEVNLNAYFQANLGPLAGIPTVKAIKTQLVAIDKSIEDCTRAAELIKETIAILDGVMSYLSFTGDGFLALERDLSNNIPNDFFPPVPNNVIENI